jgi:hypothetical protein
MSYPAIVVGPLFTWQADLYVWMTRKITRKKSGKWTPYQPGSVGSTEAELRYMLGCVETWNKKEFDIKRPKREHAVFHFGNTGAYRLTEKA